MIISIYKPSWKNEDDEKYIEIEIRWPKRPPRGWAYVEEIPLNKALRLLESATEGTNKPESVCIAARRMIRRAVSRMPR